MTRTHQYTRSRWAAVGAVVAITIGGGGLLTTSASVGSGERGVFVPITPCRLMDTRPGGDNVGPRSTPLGTGETYTTMVRGTNGNCTIPTDAIGVSMNVAIINPTASSYLTVFPADATRPLAANLNWVAGQAPTPNAVTADLSADGRLAFFNLTGSVDLAADINGYYVDHTHDDRYDTKAELAGGTTDLGILERMTNTQLAEQRWDQDPARPATIGVGDGPNDVLFDGRWIWVASYLSGEVRKIDPRTNTVVATIPTVADPERLAFDGRAIWVTNEDSDQVTLIDPDAATVASTFALPGKPLAIVFDGTSIWISLYDNSFHSVVQVRPDTRTVLATVTLNGRANDLLFDGTAIWAAEYGANRIERIDPSNGQVTNVPIRPGSKPWGLALDGRSVWYTDDNFQQFVPIDASTTTVGTPIDLPTQDDQYLPAFDGTRLFVPDCGTDTVAVVELATRHVDELVGIGDCPTAIAFDGTNVWVVAHSGDTVLKLPPQ